MKWLLKILGALARPLGISSPDDLRTRPINKTGATRPQVVHRLPADKDSPAKPASSK